MKKVRHSTHDFVSSSSSSNFSFDWFFFSIDNSFFLVLSFLIFRSQWFYRSLSTSREAGTLGCLKSKNPTAVVSKGSSWRVSSFYWSTETGFSASTASFRGFRFPGQSHHDSCRRIHWHDHRSYSGDFGENPLRCCSSLIFYSYAHEQTMAAAALGNALSDVAGIGSAWYVEKWANHFGVKYPNLTRTQVDMTSTKFATTSGRAFGVFLGCILGMIPLLFMNTKKCQDEDTSHVKTVSKKDWSAEWPPEFLLPDPRDHHHRPLPKLADSQYKLFKKLIG